VAAFQHLPHAQTTAGAPAFEVASVKVNRSGTGYASTNNRDGQVRMRNVTSRNYIQMAYDIQDYQLQGPDWLGSERSDVLAKTALDTEPEAVNQTMQTLHDGIQQLAAIERVGEPAARILGGRVE
jgi:uncharacterized protein (TIGR03435 family)